MLAAVVLLGCGQVPSRTSAIQRFRETNAEATDAEAACVVDGLLGRYPSGALSEHLETLPLDALFEEDQFREMFRCGMGGDVEAMLVDQLLGSGVAKADAPCVAGALMTSLTDQEFDDLLVGTITESFRVRFATAMADCGATGG